MNLALDYDIQPVNMAAGALAAIASLLDNPDSYKTRRAKIGGFVDYFDDQQLATIKGLLDPDLLAFFGYSIDERDADLVASRAAGS